MLVEKGRYYLYRHIRLDKNEPFYVGIGSKKNANFFTMSNEYERAFVKKRRNAWWQNITQKTNYKIDIICESNDYGFIQEKEKEFISIYKKTLCNMTLGGEGTLGVEPWNKGLNIWINKKHPNAGKKLTEETKRKKSESMKNSDKNLKGKVLPDWWREKIRQKKIGKNNPMFGKKSPMAKTVVDIVTGIEYSSIVESAKSTPYQFQYVSAMLNGSKPNKTNLRYKDGL
jgi:hypothetical protein